MPPRISRAAIAQSRSIRLAVTPIGQQGEQRCLLCSFSRTSRPSSKRSQSRQLQTLRVQARLSSSVPVTSTIISDSNAHSKGSRAELRDALLDIQKHAASYVNISRLQLALRGLDQPAGDETMRIAILALADGGTSLLIAKETLRLLLADPLKTEEEWERILLATQKGGKPILLRIGEREREEHSQGNRLVQKIHVSSPTLNGHKLEILVLEMDPPAQGSGVEDFANAVLVPTMEIPTSSTGRYTPVTTPVHKSLIISSGIPGAASVLNYPRDFDRDVISTAVDIRTSDAASLPFQAVDVALADEAVKLFRENVDNALVYERDWFASGMPEVLDWIRAGTSSTDGEMKAPLRKLVESIVQSASVGIEAEQSRQLGLALAKTVPSASLVALRKSLAKWAESAHTELRDDLDIAFNGHRWRKLGWWKLFWRVDDVPHIASDILAQRFLTNAEKEIIYLAGGIAQAGVLEHITKAAETKNWAYKPVEEKAVEVKIGSSPKPPTIRNAVGTPRDVISSQLKPRPWPLQVTITRAYLAQETIPALQALAQKLVFQTLSTSSFASAFAGLMYLGSITTTLYEAGGVAAFGIVWSLKRMQGKWEAARKFWEGEVREEGRKAVRAVEGVVGKVLEDKPPAMIEDAQLGEAKKAIERAEAALEDRK